MGPVRKTQSRALLGLLICVCIALCTIVAHSIAQNRPDNFPSYPPDNHHCSDDVCLREGGSYRQRNINRFCTEEWASILECIDEKNVPPKIKNVKNVKNVTKIKKRL